MPGRKPRRAEPPWRIIEIRLRNLGDHQDLRLHDIGENQDSHRAAEWVIEIATGVSQYQGRLDSDCIRSLGRLRGVYNITIDRDFQQRMFSVAKADTESF